MTTAEGRADILECFLEQNRCSETFKSERNFARQPNNGTLYFNQSSPEFHTCNHEDGPNEKSKDCAIKRSIDSGSWIL